MGVQEVSCEHCGRASDQALRRCDVCQAGMCFSCTEVHDEKNVCPIEPRGKSTEVNLPTLPGDMVATKKGNRTEVAWKVGHPREHQVIIEMIESAVGPKVRFNEPLHPVLVVQVIEFLMGRHVRESRAFEPCRDDNGRPDFAGFVEALEAEIEGISHIHRNDKTGQADSDQGALRRLAGHVQRVGDKLGFLGTTKDVAHVERVGDILVRKKDRVLR